MEITTFSSDTPTPITPLEAGGVSIKIEQGVLYENSYEESKIKVEMRDVSKVIHDANLPSAADHNFNGINDDYNLFNITHSIFQPDFAVKKEPDFVVKKEPAIDLDDRQPEDDALESPIVNLQCNNEILNRAPNIRPTPTSKLIAAANGTADNKRRYVCTYENCTKSYGKSSHLRSHLTWHTGIKPFVCKESGCGKGFTRSDELNRHIRTHTGEKPFECVQCTKKFSRSDHLTKHLATHSKQLSASIGQLSKKMKIEKSSSLSTLKTMPSTSLLEMTGRQKFLEMNLKAELSNTAKAECKVQIKQEIPESNTDFLITNSSREQNISATGQVLLQKNECNILIKPEPTEEPQGSESLRASNEPDDDAIMPEANLPPISQNMNLIPVVVKAEESGLLKDTINHMANSVYDPTRPFPCCHCAKNFKRQDDLNRHMRTHTGEKPFACIECEKRFMRSDHLKKHLRTHTKSR